MSRAFAVILAAGLMLGGATFAQGNATGAWDLTVKGPDGMDINATVNLKQDGEKITGSIETPQGAAELSGSLVGRALSMAFSMAGPNGNMDIKVSGDVDGATMKGVIDIAAMGAKLDFTGKKK
jgi:hypothetical protein